MISYRKLLGFQKKLTLLWSIFKGNLGLMVYVRNELSAAKPLKLTPAVTTGFKTVRC